MPGPSHPLPELYHSAQECADTKMKNHPQRCNSLWVALILLSSISFLSTGCSESHDLQQIAFQVQTDFSAELNAANSWTENLTENTRVFADHPFRIRFELNSPSTDTLHLQYRRNNSEWTYAEVAEFPYPEEASPRVSIISGEAYTVGAAEIIWPLVIRRFADGAVTNNDGDVFSFRLATTSGTPIGAHTLPELSLSIKNGHLGGTFVETPGPIGPWQTSNGDMYFIMEPSETDNVLMMVKSEDGGHTWAEADGSSRPVNDDLEGVASAYADGIIHILHQTSDNVWYHAFYTSEYTASPDTWAITDEEAAAPAEPPTQVAAIAARSDGSLVGVYGGPQKIHYKIRMANGDWTDESILDTNDNVVYSGPQTVTGIDDAVHLAYTGNDGSAWYRTIQPNGSATNRQLITRNIGTTEYDVGSILPLVFIPESNTVVTIYRLESGHLWARRITETGAMTDPVQISDRRVVQNAVDSDQVGADAIAYNEQVYLLFIEQDTGNILSTYSDKDGIWQTPMVQVDSINAQWIRGALHTLPEGHTYSYVYDAGSNGGSGMNKYAQLSLY